MKKTVLLLLAVFMSCLSITAQRYVVNGKKGKIRVVKYEKKDGRWICADKREDIYIDNGYEFEAVPPVAKDTIVMEYEGAYYHVVFPDKDLELVDDMGKESHLGFRSALRNTFIGKWYRTLMPGLIGLVCTIVALFVFFVSIFKEKVPDILRWLYALPMSLVSLLEIGAFFSIYDEAYWWVNPDDVGYLIAIVMLVPFCITIAMQLYAFKFYKYVGHLSGVMDVVVRILLGVGCVLAVITAILVIKNFLFAFFGAIGVLWLFGQKTYSKDSSGNVYENSVLGQHKLDE